MEKILTAEDDESMRSFLVRSLRRLGHEVRSVCDGFEALPRIADGAVDVLVTDVVTPSMDGLELIRRTRLEIPSLKVISIIVFAPVSLSSQVSRNIDARVLSTPFYLRTLVHEIDRVLAVV